MLRRVRNERGISLVLSLLVMTVLSVTTAGMIAYTSAGSRTASIERSRVSARSLAEAGLNNALAVLSQAVDPKTQTLLGEVTPFNNTTYTNPKRTYPLNGGSATVWGHYDPTTFLWTIWSTGHVTNPTGGAEITRTLTQKAEVVGLNQGATLDSWSRIYHDDPSPSHCLEIEDVTIAVPIASRGCMTLKGTAKITGAATTVEVGTNVTLEAGAGSPAKAPSSASGWTSSSNVYTSNNSDATNSISANSNGAYLDVTNFGFALPTSATVTGIKVEIERAASATNSLRDETVQLIRSGSAVGTNKANTSSYWGTSDATASYGSVTGTLDTWSAGLTASQVNGSTFGVRIRVRNYNTSSSRTASVDYVRITVSWTSPPNSSIGLSGANVAKAHVGGTCKYGTQAAHTPCSAADQVYAAEHSSSPQGLSKSSVDLNYWYKNAKPGPAKPCDAGGSFAGGFDNNYNAANPHPDNSRNSSYGSAEVTPPTSSYTCRVTENGTLVGEISWNHVTHVLKIKGTIYIDGDFRFDDDGQVTHYQGRGIIYATGDLEFDEMVCAGGTGLTSCYPNMSDWDPTQNLMTVLAGGWAEFDQGATQSPSTPSGLQGIIYSDSDCMVHQWFHLSGPIICDRIELPSDSWGWPTYYPWPSLGSLTEGQKYGSPVGADDYNLLPREVTG